MEDPDPLDRIDEIIRMVETARSVPMSRNNAMVDRGEMIAVLEELSAGLPRATPQGGGAAGGAGPDHGCR